MYIHPLNPEVASPTTHELLAALMDYDPQSDDLSLVQSRIKNAIAKGADINFMWEHEVSPSYRRKVSILQAFVEEFYSDKVGMANVLLEQGANPLLGALQEAISNEELALGFSMIDACITKGHTMLVGSGVQGVVGCLLGVPPDANIPDMIDYAISKNADLTPLVGMNWAHVALAGEHIFPDPNQPDFGATQARWKTIEIALDLGADLTQCDVQGVRPIDLLDAKMTPGCEKHASAGLLRRIDAARQSIALANSTPSPTSRSISKRI